MRPRSHDTARATTLKKVLTLILLVAWGCTPLPPERNGATPPASVPSGTAPAPTRTIPDATPEPEDGNAARIRIIGTLVASEDPVLTEATASPDGQWRAEIHAYDCAEIAPGEPYAYQELRVTSTHDEVAHLVDSQLIACGGLGAYGLATRFWSPNSRYLYYTDGATGVPDGCGYWTPPYKRIDTVGGQMEDLGRGMISPDGSLLAAWQGERLGIWRVDGERMALLEIPTVARMPGALSWRPDSSGLVFLISEGYCPLGETDLGRIDLAELRPIILLSYRDPSFADVAWDAPNRVTLTDEAGRLWRYNFLTRDLWPVGP